MTQTIALLIANYGVPVAMKIWSTIEDAIQNRGKPDAAMWAALMEIESAASIKAQVKAELDAAGIPTPGPTPVVPPVEPS